jgi:pimeloyl-ACP methyl ester carboxylesterase
MKKIIILILLVLAAFINVFGKPDYPFNVKVSGKGSRDILFIPGFSCSGDVWNETVERFSSAYKCHVLTMPGFAGVPAQNDPSVENWVNSVAEYIKNEKLDKPVIIGHSLGGIMSQWLAAAHPGIVSKIVVVDALPCLPALGDPNFKVQPSPDCSVITESYKNMSDQQFKIMQTRSMASLVADTSRIAAGVEWGMKSDRNTLGLVFCQLMNTDLRPKLSSIKCPALVLLESNFKGMHEQVEDQYRELKGAKLVYAGKGLHFVMYDDKDWYFQQLEAFLK